MTLIRSGRQTVTPAKAGVQASVLPFHAFPETTTTVQLTIQRSIIQRDIHGFSATRTSASGILGSGFRRNDGQHRRVKPALRTGFRLAPE